MIPDRVLAVVLVGFAVGCGSSSAEDSGTSANEVVTGDAGTDAAPPACVPCAVKYEEAAKKYAKERQRCLCGDEVCHDACGATECLHDPKPADETCKTCLDANFSQCVQSLVSSCQADAECTKYVLCKTASTCER